MLILMNVLMIAFIGGMIYRWGVQGFFSAFLHLLCVLVAGTLAFALWEPIAQGVLMRSPAAHYAWCLGLLLPFLVVLIVLRLALDRIIRKNMHFSRLSNHLGGGVCGAAAAYLTIGITVLGLITLPWGSDMGGYQPYTVAPDNRTVTANASGNFWIAPEKGTATFFAALSSRAFSSGHPMAAMRPSPVVAAVVNRLTTDAHASTISLPGTVRVERHFVATPQQLRAAGLSEEALSTFAASQDSETRFVAVELTITSQPTGTFDNDAALRLAPTQVQLWGRGDAKPNAPMLPVAYRALHVKEASIHAIDSPVTPVTSASADSTFVWIYAVPTSFEPQVLLVRNTRIELGSQAASDSAKELVDLLAHSGERTVDHKSGDEGKIVLPDVKAGTYATGVELTDALPFVMSPNKAVGSLEAPEGRIVSAYRVTSPKLQGFHANDILIRRMSIPSHLGAVRVEVGHQAARSLIGQAIINAQLQAPLLRDATGRAHAPRGYFLAKADGSCEVTFAMEPAINAAKDLPFAKMRDGDRLFLYYAVERGATVTAFEATPQNRQTFDPPLQLPQ